MLDVLEAPAVTATTPALPELRIADRCDQGGCSAQAFMRASINGANVLLFCGHHGQRNVEALKEQGFYVEDYRDRINNKPSVRANSV